MTSASVIEMANRHTAVPATLERFKALFNELDAGNLGKLRDVYAEDIRFQDPLGKVSGLNALTRYFGDAYQNA
jgi:hypothetical protein